MKMKCFVLLYAMTFLALAQTLPNNNLGNTEVYSTQEAPNGIDAYKLVVSLLEKIEIKDNLNDIKDREIKELQIKVAEFQQKDRILELYKQGNEAHITDLRNEIDYLKESKPDSDQFAKLNRTIAANLETIKNQNSQLDLLKSQIELESVQMQDIKSQLEEVKDIIKVKDEQITSLQTQKQNLANNLNETEVKLEECKFSLGGVGSCVPFALSPGIHKIETAGLDPFDVLCESAATGPGWLVIQQRLDGKEDFYRDFATYRYGFGSFDGDFFLGLEKIHRLTSNQPHELLIYLEEFNGTITYATYDHFAIAGEEDQYKLISADGFSGNTTNSFDYFKRHKDNKFYTFDKDDSDKSANKFHGGWWYASYSECNLNGKYFDHEVIGNSSIFWYKFYSLKRVQMLIRPKLV